MVGKRQIVIRTNTDLAKKPTEIAPAKLPPPLIDRGEVLKWFANNFGFYGGSARGLFISDFAETDEAALEAAILELKSRQISLLVLNGDAFYKQAEHLFEQSGSGAGFGKPAVSPIETDLGTKELVVIRDLEPPKNQAQLWYFYNHLIFPRATSGLTTIITTSKGYEEFVAAGANLEDNAFGGRPLTFEKAVWLMEASMINLSLFAMLRDNGLPPMLKDEYYLWMSLSERGIAVTPQHVFDNYMLDLALVMPDKKLDIECGGISWLDGDSVSIEEKQRYHKLFADDWQVLRFTTAEILNNYNACAEVVQEFSLTGKKRKKPGRLITSVTELSLPLTLPATMVEDVLENAAINHGGGPAALSGAAGTGKTTCLSERVVHLLDQGIDAASILVLSLNAETLAPIKALLKARLDSESFDKLSLFTWRQFGEKILNENTSAFKRKAPLKIEANPHKVLQRLLIKHLKELDPAMVDLSKGLDEFTIAGIISLYKARMISTKQAKENARDKVEEIVAKIYLAYEEQLQRSNKIDESDFVTQSVSLLLDRSDIRVRYQNQFDFVLVDELQDATPAEDMLARIVAAPQDNLFVAGDDDQAVLAGRGGQRNLLVDISHLNPSAKCYLLVKNWRSDSEIAEKASAILSAMSSRGIQKGIISGWEANDKPAIAGPNKYANEREEIDAVVKEIETLIGQGRKPKEIAVISRQGRYRELVEDSLRRRGVAYLATKQSDLTPNERLDMLSYLRLVADPDGPRAKEDFERICQIRYKDVDPKISSTIAGFAEANNLSFMRAVEIYSEATADKSCRELEQLVRVIRNMHQEKLPPAETIALLKRTQRLNDHYNSIRFPPDVYYEPMSMVGELEIAAKDFLTVSDFLKHLLISKETHIDEVVGGVSAMTAHEAKGKEFPIVFLVGLSQGCFPYLDNTDADEERRLFYLALTRAQATVYLSYAQLVKDNPQEPSMYLVEMGLIADEKPVVADLPSPPNAVSTPTPTKVSGGGLGQPVVPSKLVKEPPPRPRLVEEPKKLAAEKPAAATPPEVVKEPVVEELVLQEVPKPIPKPMAKPAESVPTTDKPAAAQAPVDPVPTPAPAISHSSPVKPNIPGEPRPVPPSPAVPEKKPEVAAKSPEPTVAKLPERAQPTPPPVPPEEKATPVPPPVPKEAVAAPIPTLALPSLVPVCPACAAPVEGDGKFCGECGYPILSVPSARDYVPYTVVDKEEKSASLCPACSAEMEAGAKFCGECGFKTS